MTSKIVLHALAAAACLLPALTPVLAQEVLDPDPNTLAPSKDPKRQHNGLAQTPPMGWNSWNKFACNVNEKVIRDTADAIAANGMKEAGYHYIVIDDCWHGERNADGFITEDRTRFPSGLKALGDYIHSKGLKFGIYSDAGSKTCGGRPGSQGHEYQDALQYARWGVDYLKYDWCSTGVRNAEEAYALMADALKASGRPILFSLCEWGNSKPWLWASKIGNMWRTTGDITDKWQGKYNYSWGVASIVDMNEPLWPYAGPGHWNDPDMLEVGNGGLTDVEYRAHFSLWAMMAAPLIAGNDVANMDDATRAILLNREVIAVDQDRLGKQGHRVAKDGTSETWSKPMADGGRTLLFWNRGETPARIEATWEQLGLPRSLSLRVRDLWAHKDLGRRKGSYAAEVAPHGVAMVRLQP
ncbi:glycoside hydrolase family 27 protein [Sphingosinicella sp. BN140058]|uniref:glycoside hydrolase family 27 protein n=1 Tax=Sphingosinicella sp. BN140058 TaxID=1892855 RepID=UPI00101352EE|nr:glycoside hydrolase family 27 protein [Sphingosinicella sp. BN140058]QAY75340.1 glycoside hydrolase family 27 protein [Sphingosinicella sp. BN140058]